jgi:hypothetical protein
VCVLDWNHALMSLRTCECQLYCHSLPRFPTDYIHVDKMNAFACMIWTRTSSLDVSLGFQDLSKTFVSFQPKDICYAVAVVGKCMSLIPGNWRKHMLFSMFSHSIGFILMFPNYCLSFFVVLFYLFSTFPIPTPFRSPF